MKSTLVSMIVIAFCFQINMGFAQKCKPDQQYKDKFTKKETTYWIEEIYKPGFTDGVMASLDNSTSSINISILVGRQGDDNFVELILSKKEASAQSANFESALKAEKGNAFLLGFKDGEPLNFLSTFVQNITKMDNVYNVLVTTVTMHCSISDADLIKLEPLANNPITAVRVSLVNGIEIEQEVRKKQGQNMMEDFVCAMKFFKEKGYYK